MSQIFIQTRARSIDYGFMIKSPSQTWWRDYCDVTSFEYPTLIIENLNGSPRIYLSAIPSERKDRVETRIRYTLVLEIEKDDHSLDDFILKLVSRWVNEVGEASKYKPIKSDIGNILDKYFSEETVDIFLRLNHPEEQVIQLLENKLKEFQEEISRWEKPKKTDFQGASWWGGIGDKANRQHWIALVDKLLSNNVYGKALVLNLAGDENDLQDILRDTKLKIICLINGDSKPQQLSERKKFISAISQLNPLKKINLGVVGSVCLFFVFLITFNLIGFSGNRLSESEVIEFVAKSCQTATKTTKPTPNSPKPENQTTNSKPTPNSPKPQNQTTNSTPTPNSPKPENQTTNSTPTPNSPKPENQTTNSTPTPNSPKPENQVIKEELATEELATKLGVSPDEILVEVKKCHESFQQWSKKYNQGTWDFEISDSKLKFNKVNL